MVSRHDPKIDLGPVDLSCAFVLCDLTLEDHPIVYVSNAFERLTGYTERERRLRGGCGTKKVVPLGRFAAIIGE